MARRQCKWFSTPQWLRTTSPPRSAVIGVQYQCFNRAWNFAEFWKRLLEAQGLSAIAKTSEMGAQ
jgi:hypothetical protein